jgi:hypothetical protein
MRVRVGGVWGVVHPVDAERGGWMRKITSSPASVLRSLVGAKVIHESRGRHHGFGLDTELLADEVAQLRVCRRGFRRVVSLERQIRTASADCCCHLIGYNFPAAATAKRP